MSTIINTGRILLVYQENNIQFDYGFYYSVVNDRGGMNWWEANAKEVFSSVCSGLEAVTAKRRYLTKCEPEGHGD